MDRQKMIIDILLRTEIYAKIQTKAVFLAILLAILLPLAAEARPSTRSYTCDDLLDFIERRGAVVMNTKGNSVYRRFVADGSYCPIEQRPHRQTVRTRDGRCTVYYCREPLRFFDHD